MNRREAVLNVLLSTAFDKYVKALETGETVEIEEDYERFVTAIVGDILPPADQVEAGTEAQDS